jgi:hypothetical protein
VDVSLTLRVLPRKHCVYVCFRSVHIYLFLCVNIRNGSALEGNLKVVLNSLVQNVNKTGYNISWYGENGDKMYGLAQCRGDLNASACGACVSNARRISVDSVAIFLEALIILRKDVF